MERKDIIKKLDDMLNIIEHKQENENKHISFLRKQVLEAAKAEGLIKDYRYTQTWQNNGYVWGSSVGYDTMYKIIL